MLLFIRYSIPTRNPLIGRVFIPESPEFFPQELRYTVVHEDSSNCFQYFLSLYESQTKIIEYTLCFMTCTSVFSHRAKDPIVTHSGVFQEMVE